MAAPAQEHFDLQRFMDAQDQVYRQVCSQLRAGRKTSHWMWFVFPQIHGLGRSATAVQYAISSMAEAQAYLDHPILGPRLRECTELASSHGERTAHAIFGTPDDMKFHSCMTLFARCKGNIAVFDRALAIFFGGVPDAATEAILRSP
ncbi:MAG: hypothetical protein JWM36_1722 [Hyphomicrobiales bacterium]|nr:hypothetical protein [Hyphomicrobiales bacterium]